MTNIFQIISAKITALITVIIITVTSILPWTATNKNKSEDLLTVLPSPIVSNSPSPSPIVIVSPSPTSTLKPKLSTPSSVVSTSSPTPTPIDWVKFEEDLKNKLSSIASPAPKPNPSYSDLHCPKVIKIEDNLGNMSIGTGLSGTFKKGSINLLTVKITATDPQNIPLYYQYGSAGLIDGNSTIKDWSKDNSYSIDVTNAMLGTNRILNFSIDNQDNFSCAGDYTDIHGNFNYTVTP